ncbi:MULTISPECIES: CapA family protein [unclassified Aerococcus]|uniref:CapA family protein n=1 Tax=unclassified Aerococcus TaxID=2618060 RepID=UPI0008A3C42E|nr:MULTISPECIES: CapA family protein [unclassified Aerococcus]MDK6369563.1 CapA family protein [Aerococcus sp. UMB9870]MDK6680051.1 CapA family protein [Aerococcus sp. UMB8608]MDK6686068.1 CapA family protein [Aerococcus sp. UMB8623]MDK6939848.1 CapA family protein [Aerococcus sp. UMB8487]OFK14214.1 metallophosphatase [Aerococcus sp. HMSC072A12]
METIHSKIFKAGLALASLALTGCQGLTSSAAKPEVETVHEARIMAHGDLLYHDPIFASAAQADGSFDFHPNFSYVKPWIQQADLSLADFEGTIDPTKPLVGYPRFNAPEEVADAMADTGYDVVDLAHNHILDSGLEGLQSTAASFSQRGMAPLGVYPDKSRQDADLLIKEVNGIKIALLAYAYGFNGLEAELTPDDYAAHLSDLDPDQMRREIERAEEEADLTIVMPQMGVEYALEPTQEQIDCYHQMVAWGADVVLGGHPHVIEPAEVIDHEGDKKLIIYSMGNFLSNQRAETMEGNTWTERGLLVDLTVEKKGDRTRIKAAQARPTWVAREDRGTYSQAFNCKQYLYQTYVLDDFIEGGAYRDRLDPAYRDRIDQAYTAVNQHVGLDWPRAKRTYQASPGIDD